MSQILHAARLKDFWRETALSYGLLRKQQAEANAVFWLAKGGSVALSSSPNLSCWIYFLRYPRVPVLVQRSVGILFTY